MECKKRRVVEVRRGHHQGGVVECKNKCVVEGCRGHHQGDVVEYKNKYVVAGRVSWKPPGGVVEHKPFN